MNRDEMILKIDKYCSERACNRCVLCKNNTYHGPFEDMDEHHLFVCCELIDLADKGESKLPTFEVKGNCVDDLFHILANNGYPVQISTTDTPDKYNVTVILK